MVKMNQKTLTYPKRELPYSAFAGNKLNSQIEGKKQNPRGLAKKLGAENEIKEDKFFNFLEKSAEKTNKIVEYTAIGLGILGLSLLAYKSVRPNEKNSNPSEISQPITEAMNYNKSNTADPYQVL